MPPPPKLHRDPAIHAQLIRMKRIRPYMEYLGWDQATRTLTLMAAPWPVRDDRDE